MQHNPTQNKVQPSWMLSSHMKCVFMLVALQWSAHNTSHTTVIRQSYVHCFSRIDEATAFEYRDYH